MAKKKRTTLPAKYQPGFLKDLDGRTEVFQRLNNSFHQILSDIGGPDELSYTRRCLIERFVFLEAVVQMWEGQILENPAEAEPLIGKWVQAINSLQGIAKIIGLQRQPRKVANLREYVEGQQ